jgi:hypothetical protein
MSFSVSPAAASTTRASASVPDHLTQRDALAPEIGERSDRAVSVDNQLHIFREQICDRPQALHRPVRSEDAGAGIGPAHDVGLGDPGFDLAGINHTEVLDRALRRLCHRDKARDAAISSMLARR